jgi:hypothetical protein
MYFAKNLYIFVILLDEARWDMGQDGTFGLFCGTAIISY